MKTKHLLSNFLETLNGFMILISCTCWREQGFEIFIQMVTKRPLRDIIPLIELLNMQSGCFSQSHPVYYSQMTPVSI